MTIPKPDANRAHTPHWPPPRSHPQGHRLVVPALNRAVAIAGIVRDGSADDIARILDPLTREQLNALIVVLAALVPDDVPTGELLQWVYDQQQTVKAIA